MQEDQELAVFGASIDDYSEVALARELVAQFGQAAPMIARFEGLRLKVYEDRDATGKVVGQAIGVGHSLATPISRRAALLIYLDDMLVKREELRKAWPAFERLDPPRQGAVLGVVFQTGVPRWLGFRRTRAALESQEWNTAVMELGDSAWYEQTPRLRSSTILAMIATGQWEREFTPETESSRRAYAEQSRAIYAGLLRAPRIAAPDEPLEV